MEAQHPWFQVSTIIQMPFDNTIIFSIYSTFNRKQSYARFARAMIRDFCLMILCLLLSNAPALSQYVWHDIDFPTSISTDSYFQVNEALPGLLFVAGSGGLDFSPCIASSTDGGSSWNWTVRTDTVLPILKVSGKSDRCAHPSASNYLFLCDSNRLILSTDYGAKWSTVTFSNGTSLNYARLFMADANNGYILSGVRNLFRTSDGGYNWSRLTSPTKYVNYFVSHYFVFDSSTICMRIYSKKSGGGIDSTWLLKTSDAGASWTSLDQTSILASDIYAMYFLDTERGWAVENIPTGLGDKQRHSIYRTVNGGNSWELLFQGELSDSVNDAWEVVSINFIDSLRGALVGNRKVATTNNGGRSWHLEDYRTTKFNSLTPNNFTGLKVRADGTIIVIGSGHQIIRGVLQPASVANAADQSVRVFPNPCSDIVRIELPESVQFKECILSDALGMIHRTCTQQEINLNSYPIGLYTLQIADTQGNHYIKTFILTR